MDPLPNEILVAIFEYLPHANRIISLVCKDWHALANVCQIGNKAYLKGYSVKYMLNHANICNYVISHIPANTDDRIVDVLEKFDNNSKHKLLHTAIKCKNYKFIELLRDKKFTIRLSPCTCLRYYHLQNYHINNARLSSYEVHDIIYADGCSATDIYHKKFIEVIVLSGIKFKVRESYGYYS